VIAHRHGFPQVPSILGPRTSADLSKSNQRRSRAPVSSTPHRRATDGRQSATGSAQARAQPRHADHRQPADCRQRPLSDSNRRPLSMEGSGCYERSPTVTSGYESPANSIRLSVRPLCPEYRRCGSNGRKLGCCARRPVDRLRSTSVGSPAQREYSRIATIQQSRPALSLVVQGGSGPPFAGSARTGR
jgi:hypothetical protein